AGRVRQSVGGPDGDLVQQQPGGGDGQRHRASDWGGGGRGDDHGHFRRQERDGGAHGDDRARGVGDGEPCHGVGAGGPGNAARSGAERRERQFALRPHDQLVERQHRSRDGERERTRDRCGRGFGHDHSHVRRAERHSDDHGEHGARGVGDGDPRHGVGASRPDDAANGDPDGRQRQPVRGSDAHVGEQAHGGRDDIAGRASGDVTGVTTGAATITATSEGKSGTAAITVSTVLVASVTVSPASASVQVGQTVQLTATPKDANGNLLAGRTVTWASSNTAVATVSASGLVTGGAAGSATVTATCEGQSGSATITVSTVPVASVTVNPATASVQVGQTVQLTATPQDANGNSLPGRTITWSSGSTAVATVSASGLVTAEPAGTATITATSEGKSGASAITVTPVPVASVTVTPASASIQTGQTAQLTATPKDVNGNPLTGRTVTWASSTPGIASVNATGLVTGVVVGTATITATSEGQSGTALITVTVPSSGGPPDPTLLLVATSSQAPLTRAYNALNVP